MRQLSHVYTAAYLINTYNGQEPFSTFIKKYFALNKKHGSTDRKQITHLCYCYFRLGRFAQQLPINNRIVIGLFFCSTTANDLLKALSPEYHQQLHLAPQEKYQFLLSTHQLGSATYHKQWVEDFFSFSSALSSTLNSIDFYLHHLRQPHLFIRIRPGKEALVQEKLQKANVPFQPITGSCLMLPNGTKLENLLQVNEEVVVQDYSSQQIANFLQLIAPIQQGSNIAVWDCCAGSGGKSILAYDTLQSIKLTVSDNRKKILIQLQERFSQAGIKNYTSFMADLTKSSASLPIQQYQLIIADVPCSGSGTWARTPEQIAFFEERQIATYVSLQQKIVTQALPSLQQGGYFLYITCSVFEAENEGMVAYLQQQCHLQLIKKELLIGYHQQADTLFAALFVK
jgi:16S rRNA (cytosine967-C5)-methyltransferase